MKLIFLFTAFLTMSLTALADGNAQCGKEAPANMVKLTGVKAAALFNSMDPISARSGADFLGRVWFTEKSKSLEISECNVGDCTYTRSSVSRCVKAFNAQIDCSVQDETSFYCIDYR